MAASVVIFGIVAYLAQKPIIAALLKPAGDQQFIFTSPGGGFDFLLKLCLYSGILGSIPVIVHQLLRYLQPLLPRDAVKMISWGSVASAFLAVVGILFGYFVGLPTAMHFLLNQFNTAQIQALITIQSYTSFVMLYLAGCALLFQVPLILLFINRIKPLSTKKLLSSERWFIVAAFVLGAIINPSPNVQDQLLLSVPMIAMYQLSIIMIWFVNRSHRKHEKIRTLLQQDAQARAARLERFQLAQRAWQPSAVMYQERPAVPAQGLPIFAPQASQRPAPTMAPRSTARSQAVKPTARSMPAPQRRYVNDFRPRPQAAPQTPQQAQAA